VASCLIASIAVSSIAITKSDKTCDCEPGPPGPAGQNGINGVNGTDGINGTNGVNGTNGINGTNGRDGGNVSFAFPTQTLAVYVSKGGNDTTATGTVAAPFLTITAALNSITDASTTKRYQIIIGTGRFDEAQVVLKPWVWLICAQRTATRITSAQNMTVSSSFSSGNNRAGVQNCLLSGSSDMLMDFQSVGGSGSNVIEFQTFFINNRMVFKGRSSADFIEVWGCQIFGNILFNGGSGLIKNSLLGGNIYMSDEGSDNVFFTFNANEIDGSITFNKTLGNTFQVTLATSPIGTSLIATGSGMSLFADAESLPSATSRTIGAGVTLSYLTSSSSVEFVPTNSSAWPVGTNTVQKALDYLITRV
jgi:hypothetical protein